MEEQLKMYWAVPRNRVLTGILLILLICFISTVLSSEDSADEKSRGVDQAAQQQSPLPKKRIDIVSLPQETTLKDPFAVPRQAMPQEAKPALPEKNPALRDKSIMVMHEHAKPVLKGIVCSGVRRIAIVEHEATSRSYQENEMVGIYRVLAIEQEWVKLQDPEENTILLKVRR